ncbi:MAG: ABC transporter substrate-binding protein [Rhodospirillales bacterium]|nr:ABC transporter substrate-binding protein [Rhodospirillales bacterium]
MRTTAASLALAAALSLAAVIAPRAHAASPTPGYALLGKPALPPDFDHFPYVNPAAPKGGEIVLAGIGSFDSLNPFIVRGTAPDDISLVWDSLLAPDPAEADVAYAHLARSMTVAPDHRSVTFVLRDAAHFNDGTPVTAEDVAWTFTTLRDKGKPFYRQYYADVASVRVDGPKTVTFLFRTARNRELPAILGQMPVLPKHWWAGRDFAAPLTDAPLGSGPYRVEKADFGRTLVLSRVRNWWAKDRPTGKGLYNFDRRRTEFFRDPTVAFEAFKAGQITFRRENISKTWATGYNFPAVRRGLVKKRAFPVHLPVGMQGFAMNTRRAVFADPRVREAMALAFDFEWTNKTLFYGLYRRTTSYFEGSEFASSGLPSPAERKLLDPWKAILPAAVFDRPFTLPVTNASGNDLPELRAALKLLEAAGWHVRHRKLVNAAGQPMRFEILADAPVFQRVLVPYATQLSHLGIEARVRIVDPAQYQERMNNFDYDMTMAVIPQSDSPGNEQIDDWSCASAKEVGSGNLMGVCSPAVDALVHDVVTAPDRAHLVTATRALDRVLLRGWYMVPNWYLDKVWAAWWDKLGHPTQPVRTGVELNAWWEDPSRAAALAAKRRH